MADNKAARGVLFADLAAGKLTPERAEAKAVQQGLGRLDPSPSADAFDPLQEPHWTLAMVVVWIMYRTTERVRECMPDWRRLHHTWAEQPDGGWRLIRTHPRSAFFELDFAYLNGDGADDLPHAKRALIEKLAAGELSATALVHGQPTPIPAHEWAFLMTASDGELKDVLVVKGRKRGDADIRYSADQLLLQRADVFRLWPAAAAKLGRRPTKSNAAAAALQAMHDESVDYGALSEKALASEVSARTGIVISTRTAGAARRNFKPK